MSDFALAATERVEPAGRRRLAGGTAAPLLLHLSLVVLLAGLSPLRQLVVPPPRPVSVEIVTPAQLAALEAPAPAPPRLTAPSGSSDAPAAPGTGAAGATAPASTISGVHIATQFYAGSILGEPSMHKMRATLDTFAPGERLVQLCNIEGLEQIRRGAPGTDPDTLVSYAMSDPVTLGLTLSAPGAAFRSRRRWYGVAFRCTVAADEDE